MSVFDHIHPKMKQRGIVSDKSGEMEYVIWKSTWHSPLEVNERYEMFGVRVNIFGDKVSLAIDQNTVIKHLSKRPLGQMVFA